MHEWIYRRKRGFEFFFDIWTKKIWWPPKISENNLVAPQNFGKKFDGPPKFRKKIWWPPKNPLASHPRLKVKVSLIEDFLLISDFHVKSFN